MRTLQEEDHRPVYGTFVSTSEHLAELLVGKTLEQSLGM